MATLGTFTAGQVLTAVELNEIATMNDGASARPLLTGGAYIDGTNGLVLSGLDGNNAETPDSAALDITGDLEIVMRLSAVNWNTSVAQTLISKHLTPERGYEWILLNGILRMQFKSGGVDYGNQSSTVMTSLSNNTMYWLRLRRASATGTVTVEYAADSATEPTVWTSLTTTGPQTAGNIDANTNPLQVGSNRTRIQVWNGIIARTIVRDGFAGTVVFDADFEAEAADTLAFTEDSSNAATVSVTTTRYTVGIPGMEGSALGTTSAAANTDRYAFFTVTDSIDVDMLAFEVTTGPSSAATAYLAIYEADDDYNPTGAPVVTTDIAVGASATGLFYAQVTPVTLKPGAYVVGINPTQTMTLRFMRGSGALVHTLGSSAFLFALLVARTAATFPTSPPVPNSRTASSSPFGFPVFLRWKAS